MLKNRPHDEAVDLSQDLSVNESFEGREKKVRWYPSSVYILTNSCLIIFGTDQPLRDVKVSNANHDEALDLSESMKDVTNNTNNSLNNTINKSLSKSQTVNNRHFDEELDLSRHSDESIDSTNLRPRNNAGLKLGNLSPTAGQKKHSNFSPTRKLDSKPMVAAGAGKPSASREHDEDESSEEGEDEEEDGKEDASYDVIDGQYNPEDYANLNVSSEVKDLFQYITRFKPQDVDVDTALKCFVPDYIPAIGEMDPFLKVL